jgi:hypothetical protein
VSISPAKKKVAILRAHFIEGLLSEYLHLKSHWGPLTRHWGEHKLTADSRKIFNATKSLATASP